MAKVRSKRGSLRYLIRNYSRIQEKCNQTILDRMLAEKARTYSLEWFADLMQGRDPDAWAERLRESSHRTEELIMALDFAMLTYRNLAMSEGLRSWRKYDALYSKYFSSSPVSVNEIAWKYGVSKSAIYDDLKEAENRLESMILGEEPTEDTIFFEDN